LAKTRLSWHPFRSTAPRLLVCACLRERERYRYPTRASPQHIEIIFLQQNHLLQSRVRLGPASPHPPKSPTAPSSFTTPSLHPPTTPHPLRCARWNPFAPPIAREYNPVAPCRLRHHFPPTRPRRSHGRGLTRSSQPPMQPKASLRNSNSISDGVNEYRLKEQKHRHNSRRQ
jgi:hypothetical protein